MRARSGLLLPASAQTAALIGRGRDQSHPALHAFGKSGGTGGARKRLSFSERLYHFRRSAHGRTGRVTANWQRNFAVRAKIDNPTALQHAYAQGSVYGHAGRGRGEIDGRPPRRIGQVFRSNRIILRFPKGPRTSPPRAG